MKAILMLDEMPNSCAECQFRLNKERYAWRCGVLRNYYKRAKHLGALLDAEKERRDDCPLIEINDNIAKLVEVAR